MPLDRNHWLVAPLFTAAVGAVVGINSLLLNLLQLASLPLYPLLPRPVYRRFIRFTQRAYTESLLLLCYLFAPTKLVLTGDPVEQMAGPESVVLIANHQAYVDWIYIWMLAQRCHAHGLVKIILKDSLKHIPIIGWGMRFFEFIFLRRNWLRDRRYLAAMLDKISQNCEPVWLLIFPEGTIYCDSTRDRSAEFAAKAGITEVPKHILLPRVTGLEFCLNHLQSDITAVYDITMAYDSIYDDCPEEIRYEALHMVSSAAPVLHFHIRRFPIDEIPIVGSPSEGVSLLKESVSEADLIAGTAPTASSLSDQQQNESSLATHPGAIDTDVDRRPANKSSHHSPPNTRSSTPGGEFLSTPFRQWLHRVFMEKDDLMDQFYATGHFPVGKRKQELTMWLGDRTHGLARALGDEGALIKVWAVYGALLCLGVAMWSASHR